MKITTTIEYNKDDVEDIISVMYQSFSPYFMLDNTTGYWKATRASLPEGATMEEITRKIFESALSIKIIDVEDGAEYYMTKSMFESGVQQAIDELYWDGDMDTIDAEVGYAILQFALFDEIIYD